MITCRGRGRISLTTVTSALHLFLEVGRGQFHHVSTGVHGKEWAGKTLNAKKMVVFIIGLFIKGDKGEN